MMATLAWVLMLPWLAVLCFAYWFLPRRLPRTRARRGFDIVAIVLSLAAAAVSTQAAWFGWQPPIHDALGQRTGEIWPALLAVLYAYGAFVVVLLICLFVRQIIWARRNHKPTD